MFGDVGGGGELYAVFKYAYVNRNVVSGSAFDPKIFLALTLSCLMV